MGQQLMRGELPAGRDTVIEWSSGVWTNEPASVACDGTDLVVTAREGSDAWRTTSYGFIHDTEHALVAELPNGSAMEVAFVLDFAEQFDQAGLFAKVDEKTWTKAGVELSDGIEGLGAVVTRGLSDWSLAPVPEWSGRQVVIRGSRSGDALTIRARVEDEPWRLVRVSPMDPDATVMAGPFCCAPTRAGLSVRFTTWRITDADASLHPED